MQDKPSRAHLAQGNISTPKESIRLASVVRARDTLEDNAVGIQTKGDAPDTGISPTYISPPERNNLRAEDLEKEDSVTNVCNLTIEELVDLIELEETESEEQGFFNVEPGDQGFYDDDWDAQHNLDT